MVPRMSQVFAARGAVRGCTDSEKAGGSVTPRLSDAAKWLRGLAHLRKGKVPTTAESMERRCRR